MAEPIEMPFGMLSRGDQSNHILDGDPDPHGNFDRKDTPRHARRHSDVSYAKTAKSIVMMFGLWNSITHS